MTWFVLALTVGSIGGVAVVAAGAVSVKRRRSTWRTVITGALLWVWGWGVLAMTFGTRSGGGSALNLAPLDLTNQSDVIDFALNVLMFFPAGVLFAIRGARLWVVLLFAAGGSSAIELMQYVLATGRTADVNDFVANVTGCVLGFLVMAAILQAVRRDRATQRSANQEGPGNP